MDEANEANVEADVNDGVPMLQTELLVRTLLQITHMAKLALSPAANKHISDLYGKRTGAGTGNKAVELDRQAAAHQLGHAPRGPYEIGDILRQEVSCLQHKLNQLFEMWPCMTIAMPFKMWAWLAEPCNS